MIESQHTQEFKLVETHQVFTIHQSSKDVQTEQEINHLHHSSWVPVHARCPHPVHSFPCVYSLWVSYESFFHELFLVYLNHDWLSTISLQKRLCFKKYVCLVRTHDFPSATCPTDKLWDGSSSFLVPRGGILSVSLSCLVHLIRHLNRLLVYNLKWFERLLGIHLKSMVQMEYELTCWLKNHRSSYYHSKFHKLPAFLDENFHVGFRSPGTFIIYNSRGHDPGARHLIRDLSIKDLIQRTIAVFYFFS